MNVERLAPADTDRARQCATLMVSSEPWITLRRSFDAALRRVQDPAIEAYVVMEGDTVIAFILLDMRGILAGYILTVCVHPEHRGRGVGADLIGWAEARVARDSPNVFLCVSSFNTGAQRLYKRLGYEVVGVLTGLVVPEYDEILMRKSSGSWQEFQRP